MKRCLSSVIVVAVTFCLGVTLTIADKRFHRRVQIKARYYGGRLAAKEDIANGKLVIRSYGIETMQHAACVALLKERFNIILESHGCSAPARSGWWRGYEDQMAETIIRRVGRTALQQTWKDAQADFDKQLSEKSRLNQ